MREDDHVRVLHMVAAAESAIKFTTGRKRADLDSDEMLLYAVVRAIELVGEAATKVSAETRAAVRSVPWRDLSNMRNRLVHGYFDINLDIVWKTVSEELPLLLEQLRAIIQEDHG